VQRQSENYCVSSDDLPDLGNMTDPIGFKIPDHLFFVHETHTSIRSSTGRYNAGYNRGTKWKIRSVW
jgi:hypothetical protein